MFTLWVGVASLSVAQAEEPAAVVEPASGTATARYAQLSLHRSNRTQWEVLDGQGHELDLHTWAALTGDRGPYERAAKAHARRTEWGWRALSLSAFTISALGVAAVRPLEEDVGKKEWVDALTRQDAFVTVAAVAGAAGFGMIVVSFAEPPPPKHLPAPIRRWVPRDQADAVIAGFNAQLREDLKVPE